MSNMKTTVTFTSYTDYAGLPDYPKTGYHTTTFDGTACTIYTYVEQFRCFLKAEGYPEKLINEVLGEVE